MDKAKFFSKGVGLGLLGALAGEILGVPISLVKTIQMDSGGFCQPIFDLGETAWFTSCGVMFYDDAVLCSLFALLGGALLGFLSVLIAYRRARKANGVPRLRWIFWLSLVFVALFLGVFYAQ